MKEAPSLLDLSAVQLPEAESSNLQRDDEKQKKKFKVFNCNCHHLKCSTLTVEKRKTTFKHFQAFEWKKQAEFIASTIFSETPTRRRSFAMNESGREEYKKNNIRKYTVDSIHVCKQVYLSTLGISSKRVDNVLKMISNENGFVNNIGKIKTSKASEEQIREVKTFLNSKTKFKNPNTETIDKLFLFPGLTQDKIYADYSSQTIGDPLSKTYFRNVMSSLNLHTFDRKTDLCYVCQNLKTEFTRTGSDKIQEDWKDHLRKAENPINSIIRIEKGQEVIFSDTLHVGFDLDASLSVPFLRDSECKDNFLPLNNINIRNLSSKTSISYLWSEDQHSKIGWGKEICSCLEEFFCPSQLSGKKHICSFSPNFGLDNFKKTFLTFIIYIVNVNKIESWTHYFLELGHSSVLASSEFERIQKIKRTNNKIYTKEEWAEKINDIKGTKCINMTENFRPYEELDSFIQFKSFDENKEPFVCSNLSCIRVNYGESFLDFKVDNDLTLPWSTVLFGRRGSSLEKLTRLPVKSISNPISMVKFKTIQSLLPMLPHNVQTYFKGLKAKKEDKVPDNLPIRYSLLSV